jgi:two-component system CheB/CheR fusion protein
MTDQKSRNNLLQRRRLRAPASHNGNGSIHDSDGQLQAILDTAVEGIIVIDEHGIIQTFNRAAVKMFGYKANEVVGSNVSLLMPHSFSAQHDKYIDRYLRTGRAVIIGIGREVDARRKDGSTFPVELAVSEFKHAGQRRFTGILRDVSNRKRLEKAIIDVSEREQQLIGKDLHDGLCQELSGIAFLVQTMHHKLKAGEQVTELAAADVSDLLQDAVKHARALARILHPVDILPGGLADALQHLALDSSEIFSIQCRFHNPRPTEISDPNAATSLYRIARECVRNAAQFPGVKQIVIALTRKNGCCELSVSDDAKRPDSANVFAGDMVHEMILHRAGVLGARIEIHARNGGGVRVTCQIPTLSAT